MIVLPTDELPLTKAIMRYGPMRVGCVITIARRYPDLTVADLAKVIGPSVRGIDEEVIAGIVEAWRAEQIARATMAP